MRLKQVLGTLTPSGTRSHYGHVVDQIVSRRDVTLAASTEAARFLKNELGHSPFDSTTKPTAEDVYAIVQQAQREYEAKTDNKKVLKWLSRFSGNIMYYSGVLDMLSQHHPEYVALVWGSMKLVLMASSDIEHSGLV